MKWIDRYFYLASSRRKVFVDCDRLDRLWTWNEFGTIETVLHRPNLRVPLVDVAAGVDEGPQVPVNLKWLKYVLHSLLVGL